MEAKELRIGNWYNQFGNYHQVEWFVLRDLSMAIDGQVWCKPIPLTEEILLKCGFTKPNNWHCYKFDINNESSLQISFEGCGYVQICRSHINAYSAKVESVHQLQNIYFALTGEELIINL